MVGTAVHESSSCYILDMSSVFESECSDESECAMMKRRRKWMETTGNVRNCNSVYSEIEDDDFIVDDDLFVASEDELIPNDESKDMFFDKKDVSMVGMDINIPKHDESIVFSM